MVKRSISNVPKIFSFLPLIKHMKKYIYSLLTYISLFFCVSLSYANSWETIISSESWSWGVETISSLKDNLRNLEDEKIWLENKLNLLKEETYLRGFFTQNPSDAEVYEIKKIIEEYRKVNISLNVELKEKSDKLEDISETRKQIVHERLEFYKKLVKYIDKAKIDEFKDYVKSDTQILRNKKEINYEINKNQKKLEEKVEIIKWRIKEYKTDFDERLRELIEVKVNEKISNLENSEKFISLSHELKRSVIEKTIEKIKSKMELFKKSEDKSSIDSKKVEIYEITLIKLNEVLGKY